MQHAKKTSQRSVFRGLSYRWKKHPKNIGAAKNFYILQKDSEMDWFCIISDDDYLEENHFNSLLNLLKKFPKAYFACNHTKRLDVENAMSFKKDEFLKAGETMGITQRLNNNA